MNDSELIPTFAREQVFRVSSLLALLMPQAAEIGIRIGIVIKGADGRYALANAAMESIFAMASGAMAGRRVGGERRILRADRRRPFPLPVAQVPGTRGG